MIPRSKSKLIAILLIHIATILVLVDNFFPSKQTEISSRIQHNLTNEVHPKHLQQNKYNIISLDDPVEKITTELTTLSSVGYTCFQGDRNVKGANCLKLVEGYEPEIAKAKYMTKAELIHPPYDYVNMTRDCDNFKRVRGYVTESLSEEERSFPIAFSILMFKDVGQFERLLRSVYRPEHAFCIHVDSKSTFEVKIAVKSVANCFKNVFVSSKSIDVQWGKYSVLEPELICMKQLWKHGHWKYWINLTGQEFPLKTNLQLTRILRAYNGANDLQGTVKRRNTWRWSAAGPAPHNIRPIKGSVHIVASRPYVDYILHNQTAKDLLQWIQKTDYPDETYFATLNHNPQLGIPGTYKGEPETDNDIKPFLSRFKNWGEWPCNGQRVRGICVFGVGDLPLLVSRPELFANKFYADYQHLTLDCLEEWHYNRTRDEYLGKYHFDTSYYGTLGFVKNKVS
ncbi:hypothetical protein ScPMuIL_017001 [Solemya velum]